MPSQVLDGLSSVAECERRTRFFADLSNGLHAMGQPLTILRSSVPASAVPGVDATKQRRYLDISSQQIERACSLYEVLRDLVIASRCEADCAPIDLANLLAAVDKDQRPVFQAAGVELRAVTPGGLPTVSGDLARTQQALSAALKVAISISAAGDVVELVVSAGREYVELAIRNDRVHGRPISSSERLSLSLAQADIVSQQGEYECADDPFCIRMALPIHLPGP